MVEVCGIKYFAYVGMNEVKACLKPDGRAPGGG